jgi:hypothetical protein
VYNFTNPGAISHNEILQMYKEVWAGWRERERERERETRARRIALHAR